MSCVLRGIPTSKLSTITESFAAFRVAKVGARRGPPPTRNGIIGTLLLALFLAAALLGPLIFYDAARKTNAGFGPEWDCANNDRGEPICVKRW